MGQLAYGTITITDTNDIESIIVEYAKNQDPQNAPITNWNTTRPPWAEGYYIWQRTRTHKTGTATSEDIIGTAVCITGSTGQTGGTGAAGRSLTSTTTQYTTATNSAIITENNMGDYTWNSNVPAYSSSTPAYWVRVTNIYSNPSSTAYVIYKDNGLTDAIAKSVEANNNSVQALSVATNVVEDAQGAIAIARAQEQHFWFNATDIGSGVNLIESGAYITDTAIDTFKSGKSGGYLLARSDKVEMGKASAKYAVLDATSLKFYTPGTTYKGIEVGTNGITIYRGWDATEQENLKGIEITPLGIDIYGSDQDDPDVMVTSDGIYMFKGGILSGTPGSTSDHFIYLSTEDLGSVYSSLDANKTDWREIIGDNFGVDSSGNVYATNAHITGTIKANEGSIGGWIINNVGLYYASSTPGASSRTIVLSSSGVGSTKSIGGSSGTNTWKLAIGQSFGVDNTGKLYASGAEIGGKISAESGYIGTATDGFIIDSYGFYVGTKTSNTTNSIALSRQLFTRTIDGTSRSDLCFAIGSKFAVDKDGNLYANGANITNVNVGIITISDISGLQNSLTYAQNNADYYFDDITNGVAVHNYTNTTQPDNRIEITSTNGLEIFKGGVSVAQYSTTARIGQIANDKSRVEIKDTGIDFYNRASSTDVALAHIGYGQGTTAGGSTSNSYYPYYTFGLRLSDNSSTRGNYSFAEGLETTASGFASHAEGYNTVASGRGAHAEGEDTVASKGHSHAEGLNTQATGHHAHAEGESTVASGYDSHAQNFYTNAGFDYQTAIGKFNNNISTNAFEIGNGSGNNTRSNAFAVDWNGVVRLKGNLFTGCSSDSTGGYEFGQKASNHIVVGGIHICWGDVSISCAAGTYTQITVTLPYTYTSAPHVFTSFASQNANARTTYGTNGGDLSLNKIHVGAVSITARNQTVCWMTIGA